MLSLFPVRRPRAGLAFSESSVSVVELAPRWRGANRIHRLATHPLPSGLLRPHRTGANIADPAELTRHVRDVLRATGQRTVAVSVPLACAYVAVFAFETMSEREEDRLAVLRWRFQQDEHLAVGDAPITYRVYPGTGAPSSEQAGKSMQTVLAVAMPQTVLQPYLTVLEQAGVIPASFSWSTLQLFDMAWPLMTPADEVVVIHQSRHSWAVMAARAGQPVFLRVKPGTMPSEQEQAAIMGTLQYYDDRYPHAAAAAEKPAVLYRLDDDCIGHTEPPAESRVLRPVCGSAWQVRQEALDWSRLNLEGPHPTNPSEWSALAGVLAS